MCIPFGHGRFLREYGLLRRTLCHFEQRGTESEEKLLVNQKSRKYLGLVNGFAVKSSEIRIRLVSSSRSSSQLQQTLSPRCPMASRSFCACRYLRTVPRQSYELHRRTAQFRFYSEDLSGNPKDAHVRDLGRAIVDDFATIRSTYREDLLIFTIIQYID